MAGGGGRRQAEQSLAGLRRRGTLPSGGAARDRSGPRHCWVQDPPGHPGRWPGVVVQWRRGPDGWQGRTVVVVVTGRDQDPVVVDAWLDADRLSPG